MRREFDPIGSIRGRSDPLGPGFGLEPAPTMTWIKLHTSLVSSPRWLTIPGQYRDVFIHLLLYAGTSTERGMVKADDKALSLSIHVRERTVTEAIDHFVRQGSLERRKDGVRVVNWDLYQQPRRDDPLQLRSRAVFYASGTAARVKERDGDRCRYCGADVDWNVRRGAHGGTFDHIDPKGDWSPENIVVACRSCNSKKSDRTPDEAGMRLRPVLVSSRPDAPPRPDDDSSSRLSREEKKREEKKTSRRRTIDPVAELRALPTQAEWWQGLAAEYPSVDLLGELRRAQDWHGADKVKSPKLFFRNWVERAARDLGVDQGEKFEPSGSVEEQLRQLEERTAVPA